jgi:hypothetical protein
MSVDWPSTLPCRFVVGVTAAPQDNAIRFQPDVGDQKVRRRYTGSLVDLSGSLTLSGNQGATFDAFYRDDLADGSLPFRMMDPLTYGTRTFRFAEPPQWTEVRPGVWSISCKIRRID